MSNTNNITTLFIPDPNGGQPQMFKVMGTSKMPVQFANSIPGSSSNAIRAFLKASSSNEQNTQIVQGAKVQNRLLNLPSKQHQVNIQGIRPVVFPANSIQIKSNQAENSQSSLHGSLQSNSPMIIQAQNVLNMAQVNTTSTLQSLVRQPSKQGNLMTNVLSDFDGTPTIIQANNIKTTGSSFRSQPSFTLKPQALLGQKHSEIVFQQQKTPAYLDGEGNSEMFQPLKGKSIDNQNIVQPRKLPQYSTVTNSRLQQVVTSSARSNSFSQSITTSPPKSLMSASILDHSGVRKRHHFDIDYNVENKRRRTEKSGKGLRHFSMKVCEKVQAKGTTSYNEVADELVSEFTEQNRNNSPSDGANYDQKNIRRRVYDALNVLMAMNIISKEKKEIHWLGLPTNSAQECSRLQIEQKKRTDRIKLKTQQLQDLILQQIAFKNLVERNRKIERENGPPTPNSAIQLPFVIVNTSKKTVIDCSISNDKTEYLFNFNDTFEIHDDIKVLKRMGMALGLERGSCSKSDLEKARSMVPRALQSYVSELAEANPSSENSNNAGYLQDELTKVYLDDEFDFAFEGSAVTDYDGEQSGMNRLSRTSSLTSLSNDQPMESESTSSFGDDDESDIEIGC